VSDGCHEGAGGFRIDELRVVDFAGRIVQDHDPVQLPFILKPTVLAAVHVQQHARNRAGADVDRVCAGPGSAPNLKSILHPRIAVMDSMLFAQLLSKSDAPLKSEYFSRYRSKIFFSSFTGTGFGLGRFHRWSYKPSNPIFRHSRLLRRMVLVWTPRISAACHHVICFVLSSLAPRQLPDTVSPPPHLRWLQRFGSATVKSGQLTC
jgi:hypothetical protein